MLLLLLSLKAFAPGEVTWPAQGDRICSFRGMWAGIFLAGSTECSRKAGGCWELLSGSVSWGARKKT